MTGQTRFVMIVLVVLYCSYAFMFTFTTLFALFHVFQGSSLNTVTIATNVSTQIQSQMHQKLEALVKHENVQLEKMFNATAGRIGACNTHLKSSLIKSSPDINEKLLGVLEDMFENSGTVNQRLEEYFAGRQGVYQENIDEFLTEFNKTLDSNLHKVQVTYAAYLKRVAENNWLKFPMEIFKKQLVLQGRHTGKLSNYLADFLTWLEIDKVQEIFEIKEIVLSR